MKKKSLLITFICVIFVVSCTKSNIEESQKDEYESVSIIQLICEPEKYHDKKIEIKGFAEISFEGTALYLCKEGWYYFSSEAVWLGIDSEIIDDELWWRINGELISEKEAIERYSGKFVEIEGTYDMNLYGHLGHFPFGTVSVTRIRERSDFNRYMYIDPNNPNYLPEYAEEYGKYYLND